MTNRRIIETSRPATQVSTRILVEQEELSGSFAPLTIVVENEANRIPMAKIVFIDGDPSAQDFNLSNQDLLIPGKEIEILAGYQGDDDSVFKGIIVKHSVKIRSQQSYLIVECRDKAVKLTLGRKNKYFYDSTDNEIIEEILSANGLDADLESTHFSHHELVQYNVSDWDFIMTRAQANGKICMVEDGKLIMKAPCLDQDAVDAVSFGDSLLDFDAEIDARNQFATITSYGWNAADQALIEAEAADPQLDLNGNISASDLAQVADLDNLELRSGGGITETSLQDWADAKALFCQLAKVRGRAKFQGTPRVKPNTILDLNGVGERFNGNVFVSAVRHQIAEGNWTCDAEFGLNPKWFTETFEINDQAAAGLLAAVNGLQVGIVSQLEDDPDGEDRILVKLPIVDNNEQGIWARVSSLDAGNNRGSFFRPEINDEVIVGFVNANPNDAIVLGMMNSSAKPAPIVATDDNHEKGFVTRSEMKLLFDDDKKSVVIETPAGKTITIDEDAGVIKLEDENSNIVTMNSDGIQIESAGDIGLSASGDVTIEGTNINITANSQCTAEGMSGIEVSSGGTAVLSGSLVQIN